MKVSLAYGRGLLDNRTTVIEPLHQAGLADERAAVLAALDAPIATAPLRAEITTVTHHHCPHRHHARHAEQPAHPVAARVFGKRLAHCAGTSLCP